jgi:putative flippase GtrA
VTSWQRFVRFNLVSGLGIIVQLAVLGVLTRTGLVGYLVATAIAVATAVVHNFLWHRRWTWSDRRGRGALSAFSAFAAVNGLISLATNLVVMMALVAGAGFPPIPSNLMAVAVAGLVNFWAGDRLVFRPCHPLQSRQ